MAPEKGIYRVVSGGDIRDQNLQICFRGEGKGHKNIKI